jgi:GTP-binding protein HflX
LLLDDKPSTFVTMRHTTKPETKKAVLVGIHLPAVSKPEFDGSLRELTRLVTTLGFEVVGQVTQKRSSEKSASVLGEGKLKELGKWTDGPGVIAAVFEKKLTKAAVKRENEKNASGDQDDDDYEDAQDSHGRPDDVDPPGDEDSNATSDYDTDDNQNSAIIEGAADIVIVDTDLSPSQLRNLESATGTTVLDRTGVIIEIFARHAKTKAARLQVEIARLTYVAPRLRESQTGGDRQGGGVGGKGSGETSLELDKRKIRDRIKELKTELASIGNEHEVRRARRGQENCVALVGYTNAGKSSLMRALTGSEILVADKLFATLDTTIRPLFPESHPKVLISDTVGFIKKLPHDLVASFKSTLDEALHASLLLYVVDAADPSFRSQLEVTLNVLAEVGAVDVPHLFVLNKCDKLTADELSRLRTEYPEGVFISTLRKDDIQMMRNKILSYFESDMVEENLFVPYTVQGAIGEIRSRARVLSENYANDGVTLRLRAHSDVIKNLNEKLKKLAGKS